MESTVCAFRLPLRGVVLYVSPVVAAAGHFLLGAQTRELFWSGSLLWKGSPTSSATKVVHGLKMKQRRLKDLDQADAHLWWLLWSGFGARCCGRWPAGSMAPLILITIERQFLEHDGVVLCRLQSWILNLCQLQLLSEASPDRFLIFTAGYEIFIFSCKMEITKFAFWSIQLDAQILNCLNWNQRISVNLRSQDSAIIIHTHKSSVRSRPKDSTVTTILEVWIAELESNKNNFQMTLMQIARGAMHIIEQDVPSMITSTRFFWFDDKHGDDAVPVVRVDPPVVDDNTPVVVPQIQRRGPLRLSSVMEIQYLQLSTPLPQVQTPDRPSGEPPAGHQLVWSIEALEDCICGTFGSELSTDGRSPYGSLCSLRCWRHVLLSSLFGLCFSVYLYLALFSRAAMYCDN